MPEYYGGAPNAFQGGVEFGAAQRARRLHENALNALIQQYGPQAADSAAAAAMQNVAQSAEQQPYVMAGMQRTDAARNAAVAQYGTIAGDPAAQAAATAQDNQNEVQRLAAGRRAAAVLQQAKANGGDIGKAFDFVQKGLTAIGLPPEQLAPLRSMLIQDPESVDEFVQLLADPNGHKALSGGQAMRNDKTGKLEWVVPTESGARAIPGYTPANAEAAAARVDQGRTRLTQNQEKLNLGWKNLDWDKVKEFLPSREAGVQHFMGEDGRVVADVEPGSPAEQTMRKNLQEVEAGDRKLINAAGTVATSADVVKREAERALPYFQGAGAGPLLQSLRLGVKLIPGTDAGNANDALKALKSRVSIDAIQQMRQNSPTGGALGNVSDKDMERMESTLARLETERDPQRMVDDIGFVVREYDRIAGLAQQDAERAQYRSTLREQNRGASFGPQPRPKPTKPSTAQPSLDDLLNHYAPVQ